MMACTSKKDSYTQEQLYEQASSGVVLIQNTYYYKITLSDNGFYSTNYVFSKLQDGKLKNISHTISNNFNEVMIRLKVQYLVLDSSYLQEERLLLTVTLSILLLTKLLSIKH